MPRELEADGKQIGSLNDHKLQCQLCLCTEREELEARRQIAPSSPAQGRGGEQEDTGPGLSDLVWAGDFYWAKP